ncbi:MAG: hypothetical protein A2912_03755 [Candidatus Buchananbacteria bacterium RIFCSPLOWO2_01_FULL_40_23b]|uniref:Uncharacterized protein n=1 Tax=Candidatus Buchananbacteria bacterium RIFCSPLOWO2_01_FULL_40_23b TaxID=1797544 RepID=A0A1G1YPJ5_9BACT|nr:MAG: hypothetical protein A2912_03755 [Candidatus Buchananbacteria bacterium RIFCSPLOWO2_01_FULL_40_23b]
MTYEPTIAFIKDTTQIFEQYYLWGKQLRSFVTDISPESRLDRIIAHLSHAHLPLEYELKPRTLTHKLTTELLGHSLVPVAFMTGLLYNPKPTQETQQMY